MSKLRHEQAFTGQDTAACSCDFAEETGVGLRAVAKNRVHVDVRVLKHHGASFRYRALAGVEFDFDELHFLAVDLEVDLIGRASRAAPAEHVGYRASHYFTVRWSLLLRLAIA